MTTLGSLLAHLNIRNDQWDALIIGDGSGTTWQKELGWASVLIERDTFDRKLFHGGMSNGTNNMAEMLAVLHPLLYLNVNKAGVRAGGYRVHIASDSEYVVRGIREMSPVWADGLKVNRELWLAMHSTRRKGLLLYSHHIPRNVIALNELSHNLANDCRRSQIAVAKQFDQDIYKANPDDA